jgi:hypothetical protein
LALLRQSSFAAGEISPTLYGRDDLAAYGHGLRRCRNFFISQHGAAVSRPGTQFVERINNVFLGDAPVKFVPFRYSEDTNYLLAFTETSFGGALHVIRDGAVVHEVTSPFHSDGSTLDLRKIKAAQVGATVYLTHPEITPQILTYGGSDTSWTFADVTFDLPTVSVVEPLLALPAPADADGKKQWKWKITLILKYENGLIRETAAREMTRENDFSGAYNPVGLSTDQYYLAGNGTATQHAAEIDATLQGILADPGYEILAWRVYRGRGKVFGLVGEEEWSYSVSTGSNRHLDFGDDPDFTIAPPEGTNPFKVYDYDGTTLLRTEEPTSCTFYEGRLVFGGTAERPHTLWMSATDNYLDFDIRYVPVADSSIELTLASRKWEEIRSLVALDRLLVFTDGGVWAVSGPGGAPAAADDLLQARVQSEVGASERDPLVLGQSVLYVADRGGMVHDLAYSDEAQGYQGGNVSFLAQHLFQQDVVSWTYARAPWNLVWAAMADGTLLSCQYQRGQIPAWTAHDTDGTVEEVCAIPEGDEDVVYVCVKRTINGSMYRYIERMTSRVVGDVSAAADGLAAAKSAICLDCSDTVAVSDSASVTGISSHLEGAEVYANAAGWATGPFTVDGGAITLPAAVTGDVHVGLLYTPEIELLDLPDGRNREKIVKRCFVDVEASRGMFVGEDFDHLSEWKMRTPDDAFDPVPLQTTTAEVRVQGSWNRGGRAVLRQTQPMPVTVTGFTREVEPRKGR